MSRTIIIAGNWKMNASKSISKQLVDAIITGTSGIDKKVIICVPFPYLAMLEDSVNSVVSFGAQNLNSNQNGAFTGEVSGSMIADFGVKYVIVGHSERRSLYGETNEIVAKKTQSALNSGLTPIFCIGEELSDRESGNTNNILHAQLQATLNVIGIKNFAKIIIAYEPVWAIGTGVTATPVQAQQTHQYIRSVIAELDENIANNLSILYGGSMNPKNASDLLACNDIDGGLIGGASLKADDFLTICKT